MRPIFNEKVMRIYGTHKRLTWSNTTAGIKKKKKKPSATFSRIQMLSFFPTVDHISPSATKIPFFSVLLCLVCFLRVFPQLCITCLSINIFFILSLKEPRKIPKASLETPEKQNTRPTNKTKIKGKQDSQIEQGTGSESGEPKTKQKERNKTVAESNTTFTIKKKKGVKYNRTIIC